MGKAWKQQKNKQRKQPGFDLDEGHKPHRGDCYAKGCEERGGEMLHCATCDALVAAGKRLEPAFTIQACIYHRFDALAKMKTHTMVGHPANIVRAVMAGLKGEL